MKHWPTRPLADAYWFQEGPGVRKWQFLNSGIKLLNVANITKQGALDLSKSDRYLSKEEVTEKYSHFLVDEGDLVIASSGISFDEDGLLRTRGAFVGPQHLPLCLNTSTVRFKPKEGVSTLAWLRYWLDSVEFRGQITRLVTGSAQQNFGPSHLKATNISLPPLAEQERIVKLLDEADELRKLRTQADRRTASLIPALFHQMFGDPAKNLKGWPEVKLVEVTSPKQWPTITQQQLTKSGFPVFGANGRIGFYSDFNHEEPTVLITCRGATCGTINVSEPKSYVTGNAMALDEPNFDLLNLQYLEWVLRVRGAQDTITGTAQPQITRQSLVRVTFPVAPLPLQTEFSQRVTEIRELEADQTASRRRLDDLFQSLVHRAFASEL